MPEWVTRYWIEWAFGLVVLGLTTAYRCLSKRIKADRAKNDAISDGVKALLRDRLIQSHNYYLDKGYCPIYAKENMEDMYEAYHGLGGNGTVTGLMEYLRKMRTEPMKGERA